MKNLTRLSEKGYKGMSRLQSSLTLVVKIFFKKIQDIEDHKSSNLITKFQSKIKTGTVLNQTEGVFMDFNRKTFGDQSIDIYEEFVDALTTKNKLELMRLCSFPFHQIVSHHMKYPECPLPFRMYDEVIEAKIAQARIFSHDVHNFNSLQTWHQIVMKFIVKEEEEILEKYNIFERRESDNEHRLWKICYLDS